MAKHTHKFISFNNSSLFIVMLRIQRPTQFILKLISIYCLSCPPQYESENLRWLLLWKVYDTHLLLKNNLFLSQNQNKYKIMSIWENKSKNFILVYKLYRKISKGIKLFFFNLKTTPPQPKSLGYILNNPSDFKNKINHLIFLSPNFKMPMVSLVPFLVFYFWSCDERYFTSLRFASAEITISAPQII